MEIISILSSAASILKSSFHYIVVISLHIGKALSSILYFLVSGIGTILWQTICAIVILIEDFQIFLNDILYNIAWALSLFYNFFHNLFGILNLASYGFYNRVETFLTSINTNYRHILTVCKGLVSGSVTLLISLKKLLILVGDGIWYAVTIIPILIWELSIITITYVTDTGGQLIYSVLSLLKNAQETIRIVVIFFIDIPIVSILGLIFLGCFVYFVSRFYMCAYNYAKFNFIRLLNNCKKRLKKKWQARPVQKGDPVNKTDKAPIEDVNICIVCQTNQKCILILPCKHLCVCTECVKQINRYSGNCPLCRSRVHRTIQVYL